MTHTLNYSFEPIRVDFEPRKIRLFEIESVSEENTDREHSTSNNREMAQFKIPPLKEFRPNNFTSEHVGTTAKDKFFADKVSYDSTPIKFERADKKKSYRFETPRFDEEIFRTAPGLGVDLIEIGNDKSLAYDFGNFPDPFSDMNLSGSLEIMKNNNRPTGNPRVTPNPHLQSEDLNDRIPSQDILQSNDQGRNAQEKRKSPVLGKKESETNNYSISTVNKLSHSPANERSTSLILLQEMDSLMKEKESLSKEVSGMEEQRDRMESNLSQAKLELEEISIRSKKSNIEDLTPDQILQFESKLSILQSENDRVQKEIDALENNKMRLIASRMKTGVDNLKLDREKGSFEASQQRINSEQENLHEIETEISRAQQEKNEIQEVLRSRQSQIAKQISEIVSEITKNDQLKKQRELEIEEEKNRIEDERIRITMETKLRMAQENMREALGEQEDKVVSEMKRLIELEKNKLKEFK